MKIGRTQRKAVAPVLATLMMIAVAVAMSVIIFVWSQGFLSQTSAAAGGQQSQQNLAASSGISIEASVFTTGASGSGTGTIIIVVRNVGSVSETLGSLTVQGVPSNTGFTGQDICTFPVTATSCSTPGATTVNTVALSSANPIAKGGSATITYSIPAGNTLPAPPTPTERALSSGDSLNIKVSTSVGTFATQQYTVP